MHFTSDHTIIQLSSILQREKGMEKKTKGNPRYSNGARRRALRKWILSSQDTCALCGKPVDKDLPACHSMAPEVDEIIPVSRGGSPFERSNLQLTHRSCNRRKSNKMPGGATISNLPISTSREW